MRQSFIKRMSIALLLFLTLGAFVPTYADPGDVTAVDNMSNARITWELEDYTPATVSAVSISRELIGGGIIPLGAPNQGITEHVDNEWVTFPQGDVYKWIVTVTLSDATTRTYESNLLGRAFQSIVTFNLTLNTGESPAGAKLTLTNTVTASNFTPVTGTFGESGVLTMPSTYSGNYNLKIELPGYETIEEPLTIAGNPTKDYTLNVIPRPVSNLYVTPTGLASWNLEFTVYDPIPQGVGGAGELIKDFEDAKAITVDLTSTPKDTWWQNLAPATGKQWQNATLHYGVAGHNSARQARIYGNDLAHIGNVATLASPVMDLSNASEPYVTFWYRLVPSTSTPVAVDKLEVFYRNGTTGWTLLETFTDAQSDWTEAKVVLPNPDATYEIGFNGTLQGGRGVCLDDITIIQELPGDPGDVARTYNIYLDSSLTPLNGSGITDMFYQLPVVNLVSMQDYNVEVEVVYATTPETKSAKKLYNFVFIGCDAYDVCSGLTGTQVTQTKDAKIDWTNPTGPIDSIRVYRDGVLLTKPALDPATVTYTDLALADGVYEYILQYVYDDGAETCMDDSDAIVEVTIVSTGTFSGIVSANLPTSEPLEGVTVSLLNTTTGAVIDGKTTTTNDLGEYKFEGLAAGFYCIKMEKSPSYLAYNSFDRPTPIPSEVKYFATEVISEALWVNPNDKVVTNVVATDEDPVDEVTISWTKPALETTPAKALVSYDIYFNDEIASPDRSGATIYDNVAATTDPLEYVFDWSGFTHGRFAFGVHAIYHPTPSNNAKDIVWSTPIEKKMETTVEGTVTVNIHDDSPVGAVITFTNLNEVDGEGDPLVTTVTIANEDGTYEITDFRKGSYDIEITHTTSNTVYAPQTLSDVTITADPSEFNFDLKEELTVPQNLHISRTGLMTWEKTRDLLEYRVFLDDVKLAEGITDNFYQIHENVLDTLKDGKVYEGKVTAYYDTGESAFSNVYDFVYYACANFDAPAAVKAKQNEGSMEVELTWEYEAPTVLPSSLEDPATGKTVVGIRIYRDGVLVTETGHDLNTYTDADASLVAGQEYVYTFQYVYWDGAESCLGAPEATITLTSVGRVEGTVFADIEIPVAIKDVEVTFTDKDGKTTTAKSDATGTFTKDLEAGTYTVSLAKADYISLPVAPATIEVTVTPNALNATALAGIEMQEFPYAPTAVLAVADADEATITWTAPKETPSKGLMGYNIYVYDCRDNDAYVEMIPGILATETEYVYEWETGMVEDYGVYKFGVEAIYYPNESEIVKSNCVDLEMFVEVAVAVTMNDGTSPAGTVVTFINTIEVDGEGDPLIETTTLDATGTFTFENFRKGEYDFVVKHDKFDDITGTTLIDDDDEFVWIMQETLTPLDELYITPTAYATWSFATPAPTPAPLRSLEEYKIFLDDVHFADTPNEYFDFVKAGATLVEGQTYKVSVSVDYTTGESVKLDETFTYKSCASYAVPTAFAITQTQGTTDAVLTWVNPALATVDFMEIRRGTTLIEDDYDPTSGTYTDSDLDAGTYTYSLTLVYNDGSVTCTPVEKSITIKSTGTIEGTVVFAIDGKPAEGATVTIESEDDTYTTTTDEDGIYTYTVEAGIYEVTASLTGYLTNTLDTKWTVVELGTTTVDEIELMEVPVGVTNVTATVQEGAVYVAWDGSEFPTRGLIGYDVYRTGCYGGDLELLANILDPSIENFVDTKWADLEWGTYKWGVISVYDLNQSEIEYSNCLDKNMDVTATVKVQLNTAESPAGTKVTFTNTTEPKPENNAVVTLDASGTADVVVRKGDYTITAEKTGYGTKTQTATIEEAKTITFVLEELLTPLAELYVTPTAYATWNFGTRSVEQYKVYLNGTFIANTTDQFYQFDVNTLESGEEYTAKVIVSYTTGNSAEKEYTFTYIACDEWETPETLAAAQTEGTKNVVLSWTNPTTIGEVATMNIYRNGSLLKGDISMETPVTTYTDSNVANGAYTYELQFVYKNGAVSCDGPTATVTVISTGTINGTVTAQLGGAAIEGATITVSKTGNSYTFTTDASGKYEGTVEAGTYTVAVAAEGFEPQSKTGQAVAILGTKTVDFSLYETPEGVDEVLAWEEDGVVRIAWDGTQPPVPLYDGWMQHNTGDVIIGSVGLGAAAGGEMWGISRYTPEDLAAYGVQDGQTITKVGIGIGTQAANITAFSVRIWQGGTSPSTPGELLVDQQISNPTSFTENTVNEFALTTPFAIDVTKELWVGYKVVNTAGYPMGRDGGPVVPGKGDILCINGTAWQTMYGNYGWNYNFIIKTWVSGSDDKAIVLGGDYKVNTSVNTACESLDINAVVINNINEQPTVTNVAEATRGLVGYNVYRTGCYGGDLELLASLPATAGSFVDNSWSGLDAGVYRWGVVSVYDLNESEIVYSNCLDKDMTVAVDVAVTLNTNESPEGAKVTFTNVSEPDAELVYEVVLDATGTHTFAEFRKGTYEVAVGKIGFVTHNETLEIDDDASLAWTLIEALMPPASLYVTPTAYATWMTPVPFEGFYESFDNGLPETWTIENSGSAGAKWKGVANYKGYSINGTPFVMSDSDATVLGTANEVLTTPAVDASMCAQLYLSFTQYYYHYGSGSFAKVEVYDGKNWVTVLNQTASSGSWAAPVAKEIDVTPYVNKNFQVRFHYKAGWAYYWSIDDVLLSETSTTRAIEQYKVYLDGVLVGSTTDMFYQYDVTDMVSGQEYLSEVAIDYTTGQSIKAAYTFTYIACDEFGNPTNLTAAQQTGTSDVKLDWTNADLSDVDFLRIYRNGEVHEELSMDTPAATWTDTGLTTGTYTYALTYVYDDGAESCIDAATVTLDVVTTGTINGTVTAQLGGAAVSGATITVSNADNTYTFTTAANGNYTGAVVSGTYTVAVEATGFVGQSVTGVAITAVGTTTQDFVLYENPVGVPEVIAWEENGSVQVSWTGGPIPTEDYARIELVANNTWGDGSGYVMLFDADANMYPEMPTGNFGGTMPAAFFNEFEYTLPEGATNTYATPAVVTGSATIDIPAGTYDYIIVNPDGSNTWVAGSGGPASTTADNFVFEKDKKYTFTMAIYGTGDGASLTVEDFTFTKETVMNIVRPRPAVTNNVPVEQVSMNNNDSQCKTVEFVKEISAEEVAAIIAASNPAQTTRGLVGYNVYRTGCYDEDLELLASLPATATGYVDNMWSSLEPGVYRWGVVSVYDLNESDPVYSNCLNNAMDVPVSVTVALATGESPEGTKVLFTNVSEPDMELIYEAELDETGYHMFETFRRGTYDITVSLKGYTTLVLTEEVSEATDFVWILEEAIEPVLELVVGPTGFATWKSPMATFEPFYESFDEGLSEGWTVENNGSAGAKWTVVSSYSGNSLNGTPFIMSDSDVTFLGNANEMLTSPVIDASGADQLYLNFTQYYYHLGSSAFTKVEVYNGSEWVTVLNQTASVGSWAAPVATEIDVTEYANENFQFRFHYVAGWAYYWSLDDILLSEEPADSRALQSYKVWLDGVFCADTYNTYYQHDVTNLVEGEEYTTEVAVMYTSGMSEKASYTWIYESCEIYPGTKTFDAEVQNLDVKLTWTLPDDPIVGPVETYELKYCSDTYYDAIGLIDGGTFDVAIRFSASDMADYAGWKLKDVSMYVKDIPTTTSIKAWTGADAATNVLNQTVTPTSEAWKTHDVTSDVVVESGKEFWVGYGVTHGAGQYVTGMDAGPAAATGYSDMIGLSGTWYALPAALQGANNNWMIKATIESPSGKQAVITKNQVLPQVQYNNGSTELATTGKAMTIDNSMAEVSPFATATGVQPKSRAQWDLLKTFTTSAGGEQAVVTDGNYIYTAFWSTAGQFGKYEMDGTFVETFSISGAGATRDITYDGEYFYASAGSTTIYKLDLANKTLISTINSAKTARHISFDPETGGFYVGDWSDLSLISSTGTLVKTCAAPASIYGSAYYAPQDGSGPYLLLNSQGNGNGTARIDRYDIVSNTITTNVFNIGAIGSAGGAFVANYGDKVALYANMQVTPNIINIYELEEGSITPPPPPVEVAGVNIYRNGEMIAFNIKGNEYLDKEVGYGLHEYCIEVVYVNYALSCYGNCLDAEIEYPCDAPENLVGKYVWIEEGNYGAEISWGSQSVGDVARIELVANNVWGDGSGYVMLFDADANMYPEMPTGNFGGTMPAAFFNEFEYTLPEGATNTYATPAVVTGSATIDIPAGTYDYIIVNPDGSNTWVAGSGGPASTTADNFVFEAGKHYTFTMAIYGTGDGASLVITDLGKVATNLQSVKPTISTGVEASVYGLNTKTTNDVIAVSEEELAIRITKLNAVTEAPKATRDVLSYNVYRRLGTTGAYAVIANVPAVAGQTEYDYFDNGAEPGQYYYQVTALHAFEDGHECESAPALSAENPANDYVIVNITDIGENFAEARVYPNPAKNAVTIEASNMNRITVVSVLGQVVYDAQVDGSSIERLDVSQFEAGVYVLRIAAENGVSTKRITVVR